MFDHSYFDFNDGRAPKDAQEDIIDHQSQKHPQSAFIAGPISPNPACKLTTPEFTDNYGDINGG